MLSLKQLAALGVVALLAVVGVSMTGTPDWLPVSTGMVEAGLFAAGMLMAFVMALKADLSARERALSFVTIIALTVLSVQTILPDLFGTVFGGVAGQVEMVAGVAVALGFVGMMVDLLIWE